MTTQSLNIGMISHYLPGGSKIGAGYQAHYLANAMVRRGHRVVVHTLCDPPDDARYETVKIDAGYRLRTFRFAWELRKIEWSQFDVLHAHGDDYWLWALGAESKPPHVRTMHGSCFAEAAHIPRLVDKLRMAMLGLSEVLATAVADRTVCVSQNTRAYYPWVKQVILNGVDTGAFHPGGQKSAEPTILFVGTYQNRKRGRLLMDAFDRVVLPRIPESQLWMVCSDAPAARNVTVFGRLPTEALAELYRRAWVFCLPSSYEGFGVPYIEAMATGTPVLATPNVGALEVLGRGAYGMIVKPASLGEALVRLLNDGSERDRFTRLGIERTAEFSFDRIAAQYEQLYANLGKWSALTQTSVRTG